MLCALTHWAPMSAPAILGSLEMESHVKVPHFCYCIVLLENVGYSADLNECVSNPCHVNATCADTQGSFICTCNDGFTGDGLTCQSESLKSLTEVFFYMHMHHLQMRTNVSPIPVMSMPHVLTLKVPSYAPAMMDSLEMG